MAQRVTFEDKELYQDQPSIPVKKKIRYQDVNELKTVANSHADSIESVETSLSNKADADTLDGHIADNSNPHQVTASQVGAPTVSEMNSAISSALVVKTYLAKRQFYNQEWRANLGLNTSTGATSSNTTFDVTGFIEVPADTSITMRTNDASAMTVYGWCYTSSFVAISEIRASALIGTTLTTYTFTTPANAKYLIVYTRNGGTASATTRGWREKLVIESAADVTFNNTYTPEQFTGTDTQKIQAAVDAAKGSQSHVVLDGSYLISEAIIVYSGTKLSGKGRVKGAVGIRDNLVRNEAVRDPSSIIARGNNDISITGLTFEGSDENWGGTGPSGIGSQYWRPISVLFANCENVFFDNIRFKSTAMWSVCFEQCRRIKVTNIDFNQDGRQQNQDGINIRRGTHDVLISNVTGTTYDDAVALTNIGGFTEHNILGATIYENLASNLDVYNVTINNISTTTEVIITAAVSPNIFGSGILVLCEDTLKIYNVSIDNVTNQRAHLYVGFTAAAYHTTSQCQYGDMHNINVRNVRSNVYIKRPLVNCSFENVKSIDDTGVYGLCTFPTGSQFVSRKYNNKPWEYYTTRVPLVHETFELADVDISGRSPLPLAVTVWNKPIGTSTRTIDSNQSSSQMGAIGSSGNTMAYYHTTSASRNGELQIVPEVVTANLSILIASDGTINNRLLINVHTLAVSQTVAGSGSAPYAGSGTTMNRQRVSAVLNGTSLKLFRDDVLVQDVTVTSGLPNGGIGIVIENTDTTIRISDFKFLPL